MFQQRSLCHVIPYHAMFHVLVVFSSLKGKRSEMDEKLFTVLREVNPTNSDVLYIIDARPYKAAMGNTVMGKGYENTTNYEKSVLCFMNIGKIEKIHVE